MNKRLAPLVPFLLVALAGVALAAAPTMPPFKTSYIQVDDLSNQAGTGPLRLLFGGRYKSDNSNYVEVKAPASLAASWIWTYPGDDGTTGQVLSTDGSGVLSWVTALLDPMTTRGDLIVRDASNLTARLAVGAAARLLRSNGTDPSWAQAVLTTDVTGTLPLANGGTNGTTATTGFNNLSPTTSRGDLVTRDATNNVRLAIGAAARVLRSDGTDPSWSQVAAATDISGQLPLANGGTAGTTATTGFNNLSPTSARGDLITRDATNNVRLAVGAANRVLRSDGTDPSWSQVAAATDISGLLPIANGGSNGSTATTGFNNLAPTSARGDLITRDATNNVRLAVGAAARVLRSDGTDPSWSQVAAATDISGQLPLANGGTAVNATGVTYPTTATTDGSFVMKGNVAQTIDGTKTFSADLLIGTATGSANIESSAGSNSTPTYSYVGDTDTGQYRAGSDAIGLAVGGIATYNLQADVETISRGAATFTLAMRRANTSVAAPSSVVDTNQLGIIEFDGYSTAAGGYRNAAQIISAVDGTPDQTATDMPGRLMFFTTQDGTVTSTERMRIDSGGLVQVGQTTGFAQISPTATAANTTYGFINDPNTGMWESATDTLQLGTAGTSRFSISSAGKISQHQGGASPSTNSWFQSDNGSYADTWTPVTGTTISLPNILVNGTNGRTAFVAYNDGTTLGPAGDNHGFLFIDPNNGTAATGAYQAFAIRAGTDTGGPAAATSLTTKFAVNRVGTVNAGSGSVSLPGLSFINDPDTGVFPSAANTLDLVTAGISRLSVGSTILTQTGSASQARYAFSTTGGVNGFLEAASTPEISIGALSNHPLNLYTNSTIRQTISAAGGVSISETTGGLGNVPHACTYRKSTTGATNPATVNCSSGEIAMGGGCIQTSGQTLQISGNATSTAWTCQWAVAPTNAFAHAMCCVY